MRTRDSLLIGLTPILLVEGMLNPILFTPSFPMFLILVALVDAELAGPHRARPALQAAIAAA